MTFFKTRKCGGGNRSRDVTAGERERHSHLSNTHSHTYRCTHCTLTHIQCTHVHTLSHTHNTHRCTHTHSHLKKLSHILYPHLHIQYKHVVKNTHHTLKHTHTHTHTLTRSDVEVLQEKEELKAPALPGATAEECSHSHSLSPLVAPGNRYHRSCDPLAALLWLLL